MNLNLAKELYFREIDGWARQEQRLSTYLSLLALQGGILYFLVRQVPTAVHVDQTIATVLAAFFYVGTVCFVGFAMWPRRREVLTRGGPLTGVLPRPHRLLRSDRLHAAKC